MLPTAVGMMTLFTVTEMAADAGAPPASVTEAVIVWVPSESALVEMEPPIPSAPSRLELHASVAVRDPSSASLAEPVNVMELPCVYVDPSAGAVIVTVGLLFPAEPDRV